jgi:putative tryptophan/tyrosine transport system substrate-binding protein
MAYSASLAYQAREMAGCVDKILKGAKPAELTVAQPTKFELVIILKISGRRRGLERSKAP